MGSVIPPSERCSDWILNANDLLSLNAMNNLSKKFNHLAQFSRDHGANAALFFGVERLVINPRYIQYCLEGCPSYGMAPSCPPHTLAPEQFKHTLTQFTMFLAMRVDVPAEVLKEEEGRKHYSQKMHQLAALTEQEALQIGFSPVLGIGAGSCKELFCPDDEQCQVLNHGACPYHDQARISLSALGIDAGKLCEEVGWQLGWKAFSRYGDREMAAMLGLVLVGRGEM